VHLAALAEALTVCKVAGMDMNTAMRRSVFPTVIPLSTRRIAGHPERQPRHRFTMDLVIQGLGLFDALAKQLGVPLELSPLVLDIFKDGQRRYGRESSLPTSSNASSRPAVSKCWARDFPRRMVDDEPEAPGYEVIPPASGRGRGLAL